MPEVYSTGVALDFSEHKKKIKPERQRMSKEEYEQKTLEKINNVVSRDGGSYAEFTNGVGLLVAGAKHKGRYYFAWLDGDRKLQFTDIRDTFHLLSYHPRLSILDWLLKTEKQTIKEIVYDFFKRESETDDPDRYELVGKINMGKKYAKENSSPKNRDKKSSDNNTANQKKKRKRTRSKNRKPAAEKQTD